MPTLTQSATSTMRIWQQVEDILIDGTVQDPTGWPVSLAFIPQPQYGPPPNPQDSDYHTATWGTGAGPTYWAGVLVGPENGGVVLAAGAYVINVRVTGSPEVPELWGYSLLIT